MTLYDAMQLLHKPKMGIISLTVLSHFCWVVTTHLVVTFFWVEVSKAFGFPYVWKCLRISCLNEETREELLETCIHLSIWLSNKDIIPPRPPSLFIYVVLYDAFIFSFFHGY
jgi:hypothetical protein